MSYLGMAVVFAAIAFVVANAVLSIVTVAAWPLLRDRLRRPAALLVLRLLPSSGGLAAAGLALPAYLAFEPQRAGERASVALVTFIATAAGLVAAGIVRAAASWLTTRRIERSWRSVAEPGTIGGLRVERVPTALPFAAIVGIMRPRLYVSGLLMDVLTSEQRAAVLAHEAGHRRALDNLKRALIRLSPDVLSLTRTGRSIEAAWSAAAEEAADDHAAAAVGRLAVADALIAASRLAPVRLATVVNFCDAGTIAHRVTRLLEGQTPAPSGRRAVRLLSISALAVVVAVAAGSLPLVYAATEGIVRRLQ